jgi:REP element-mobilizing transposase RayT
MSTYVSLHYHLVFATKHREPLIKPHWIGRLHAYLGGTIKGLGGVCEEVGGVSDHVHLLVGLKATHCLSDLLRDLKRTATLWVHQEVGEKAFQWQDGYAAFTVSSTIRPSVGGYIRKQEQHHRQENFRDELVSLLRRAGVAYDERYLD